MHRFVSAFPDTVGVESPPVTTGRRAAAVAMFVFVVGAVRAALFWRGAPDQPYVDLSWDPASHVLSGLDFFDALRRFDLLSFLRTAFGNHWWPPLFGVLTLPLHAILGRSDLPARLLSGLSYAALPAFCACAVIIVTYGRAVIAMAAGLTLTLLLYLTSPQLLEMSRWPMLEGCAAAMGLASVLAFCVSERRGWHRVAFVLAGLSTFLKYHYGFFLLVTLAFGVILRMNEDDRARLGSALKAFVMKPVIATLGVVMITLLVLPVEAVRRTRWIPTGENVPWLVYATTIVLVLAVPTWRAAARRGWRTLPPIARDFLRFGLAIPGVWCLDPSNARVWYRQMRIATDPPAVFTDQVHRLARFITYDYVVSPFWLLPLIGLGLVALVTRRTRVLSLPLATHAIWPILLMTISNFSAEPRFLASLMPVAFAAAILGWAILLADLPARPRGAVAGGLAIVVVFGLAAAFSRAGDIESRKTYHYRYTIPEGRFLEEATPLLARGRPVLVVLPDDSQVTPTLRLLLRLRMPDVPPDDVVVVQGNAGDLEGRARRFQEGLIAFDKRWPPPPNVQPVAEVPVHDREGSTLLITERRSPSP